MKSIFLASALPFMSKNKKAKIEDGPWNKDNADRPNGSLLAGLEQQSLRCWEFLQLQQSHEYLWPRPSDRRKVIQPLNRSCLTLTSNIRALSVLRSTKV